MWVFYLISLPLTLGMVVFTLRYFAGPDVPGYVIFTVGYTWFCSLSVIILVPADIWTTMTDHSSFGISFFWSLSYWSTFFLTWGVVPTLKGYEDAGDFTMAERLKTSVGRNLAFFLCVGSVGLVGLILLIIWHKHWNGTGGIHGLAMACSNTFGLVTGAFLLGFGLSEIPKGMWKSADWVARQKALSHQVAKMAVRFDDAHQELSNVIVVAQATSSQMSKRDPFRPFMNVIDNMLHKMLMVDPSFKPQGGRFGENDMDYDTDAKSMAMLRRRLRIAGEQYCRYRSEYIKSVLEALELEDTIKNQECRDATGWKYVSSFRAERAGKLGPFLDIIEFIWRCVLRKQLMKLCAIILGGMSAAILIAEATILPSGVDLSLFSILINYVGMREMLMQVAAFVPLMYMCICTYYSLFKIGMLMFYSFTPHQTSSVSLLMICSMVARYAPPISYNFLNLIHLPGDKKTVFEKRMGNIDHAVPFFGNDFNRIYPLIMVLYTLILATNFFDRVIDYVGNWKIFKFKNRLDGTDGFDPSGLIILQRERYWLQQGHNVGEHVIPLSRNFNNTSIDFESSTNDTDKADTLVKVSNENVSRNGSQLKPLKDGPLHATSREDAGKQTAPMNPSEDDSMALTIQQGDPKNATTKPSSGFASKWNSMKTSFQSFKTNFGSRKFIPLSQSQDDKDTSTNDSRPESLDEIFERLKRPSPSGDEYEDDEDDLYDHHGSGSSKLHPSR